MKKFITLFFIISMLIFLPACNEIFEPGDISIVNVESQEIVEELSLSVAQKEYIEIKFEKEVQLLGVDTTTSSDCISVQINKNEITVVGLEPGEGELSIDILVEGYEKYTMNLFVQVSLRTQQFAYEPEPISIEDSTLISLEDIQESLLHESTKYILAQRLARGEDITRSDLVESEAITKNTGEEIIVTVGNNATFALPMVEDTLITMTSLNEELFSVTQTETEYTICPQKAGSGTLNMQLQRKNYEDLIIELKVLVKEDAPQVYFGEGEMELEIMMEKVLDYIVYPETAIVSIEDNDLFTSKIVDGITYVKGEGLGTSMITMNVEAPNYQAQVFTYPITVTPVKTKLEVANTDLNLILAEQTSIEVAKNQEAVISLDYDFSALDVEIKEDSLLITPLLEGKFELQILVKEENYLDNQVTVTVTSKKGSVNLSLSESKISANSIYGTTVNVSSSTPNAEIKVTATEGIIANYSNGKVSITATKNGTVGIEATEKNHTTTIQKIEVTYVIPTVSMEVSKTSQTITGTAVEYINLTKEEGTELTLTTTGGVTASYDSYNSVIVISATSGGSVQVTATKNGYQSVSKTINITYKDAVVAATSSSEWVSQVIALVNQERANAGLGALTYSQSLTDAANVRAKEIVTLFSHTRPDGSAWSTVLEGVVYGENIAYGYTTPEAVMVGWMNSQGHKENILRDYFNTIGIGIYQEGNVIYWVQLFGL